MPPKKDTEVVFFLTNVGKQPADGDAQFFEKSREVMKLITEKKIFLRPADEVGIMLVGQSDNEETSLLMRNLVPTWDHVETITQIETTNNSFTYWPKALKEVVEFLNKNASATRIILVLLFDCEAQCVGLKSFNYQTVAKSLIEKEIQLLWIGSKPLTDMSASKYNESEKVLMQLITLAKGEYMVMDKTLPTLRIFKKHKSRFVAWRCPLDISGILIPTATYVHTVRALDTPKFKTIKTTYHNNEMTVDVQRSKKEYIDRKRQNHPLSDTISGYKYGRKFVPITEDDEKAMTLKAEASKSFQVYGFVLREDVKLEELGDSMRIVVHDGPEAKERFYCLVQTMMKDSVVAIVRRVYQAKNAAKMGVLVPVDVPGEPACLALIELVFEEDQRMVDTYDSLQSTIDDLAKEETDTVGDWMDSMMLKNEDESGPEMFAPGTIPSPGLQHMWNALSYRALNPGGCLLEMNETLRMLHRTPELIKNRSEPALRKLKELFPINIRAKSSTGFKDPKAQVPDIAPIAKNVDSNVEHMDEITFESEKLNVDLDALLNEEMDM